MRHATCVLALLLASVFPADAQAQMTVTPFAGVSVAGETGFVDVEQSAGNTKAVYGAAVGWRASPRWTLGVEAALMPRFLKGDGELIERGRLTSVLASVEYAVWPRASSPRFQLFLSAGAGVVRVEIDDALDAFTASSTLPAGHVGAGVLLPLSNRLRVRSDVRYVRSTFESGGAAAFGEAHVSFWRITSGIAIALGRSFDIEPATLDTAASALTGRHQPAAREHSHLYGLSRVHRHLLSAWSQRGTGDR